MVKTVVTKGIQGPAGPPGPPGPTDNAGPGLIVNSAGNIAANFGTETGTVADGGVLTAETLARIAGQTDNATAAATAQSTANAAAPQTALNSEASTRAQADGVLTAAAAAAQATAATAQSTASTAASTASAASATASQALTAAAGAVPSEAPIITAPLSNPKVIAASYTIPANNNAVNFGPITIAQGATVTVPQSSTYRIF